MSQKNIIIAGGGFGGVETYRQLCRLLGQRTDVHIDVVNRTPYFLYVPLLHEVATGQLPPEFITQNWGDFLRPGDTFHHDEVLTVDPDQRRLNLRRTQLSFDYLVIALGCKTNFFNTPGQELALDLKTIDDAMKIRQQLLTACRGAVANGDRMIKPVILIGGGPTGVETAGQMREWFDDLQHAFPNLEFKKTKIYILQSADRLLPQLHPALGETANDYLTTHGVHVLLKTKADKITQEAVYLSTGETLDYSLVIWTAGITPGTEAIVPTKMCNDKKQIVVTPTLQCQDYPTIFAIGDCAAVPTATASAQAAWRAGAVCARNVYRHLMNQPLAAFTYRSVGDLVPLSDWMGVAKIGPLKIKGFPALVIRRVAFLKSMYSWSQRSAIFLRWLLASISPRASK